LLDQQNFSEKLLKWYHNERSHIAVPGRGDDDPYAIWIAEIMLQQTQVSTVWPYYRRWMAQYPTIEKLAKADLDEVLKSWEGLGYYSRARNLHRAATTILKNFDGKLPDSVEKLTQIPGIGEYTAAAIASMAFNQVIPLVDGNVLRVMTRVWNINSDIARTATKKEIHSRLVQIIPIQEPGAFNQAIMDLGRVICTPRNPLCSECPINETCRAFKKGNVELLPVKTRSRQIPHYDIVIGLIRKNNRVLIQKRPAEGLLGGLWEFPGGKIEPGESAEAALLREIVEETGMIVTLNEKIGVVDHAYTHFKITLSAWWCDWKSGKAQHFAATENRWITMDTINSYALPKANLKILELL